MVNFPASLDAFSDPAGAAVQGSTTPTHSGHHQNHNDAIEAIEAKLGIGAGAATANTVLRGTGAGATAFGKVVSADITDGTIDTVDLAPNAVTKTASLAIAGTSTNSTSLVDMAASTMPTYTGSGGDTYLLVSLIGLSMQSGGPGLLTVYFSDNGSLTKTVVFQEYTVLSQSKSLTIANGLGAISGAHTFKLQWQITTGTVQLLSAQMLVFEFKK